MQARPRRSVHANTLRQGENYSSYTNITYNAANERTWADTWANIGLIAVAGTLAGVAISLSAANYELAATLGAVAVGAGGKVVAEAVGDTVGEKVAVGVDDKEE